MTTLLALDTATEACSVALLHDGKVTSHYEVIPRMHAQKLLPMIKQLLANSGVALNALDAIAFGRGPGAFTGVRIAIGVVQGLAFALERPVLPVSNLAALAQGALREHGVQQVAAAIDARMDEVYWGCYKAEAGEMRLQGLEAVLPPERVALPEGSSGDWFGAGTGGAMPSAWRCRPVPRTLQPCQTPWTSSAWPTSPGPVARQSSPNRRNRFTCAIM
jgi:Inactive homolog of metal-dependent proteases, putative molecular chaperone